MTMEQNRKYTFGHVREMDTDQRKKAEETRTVTFVISNGEKDRHGTVLKPARWDLSNYKKNPIVGYQHNVYGSFFGDDNPDMILGKGKVYREGDLLLGDVTFEPKEINELAEKVFQKVLFGSLRSASVGFIPTGEGKYGKDDEAEGEKNQTYYYGGQELLEWSIVNIPSLASANARSEDKKEALEFFDKATKELLGENYNEKLTVKGIRNILGAEVREETEEVTKVKVTTTSDTTYSDDTTTYEFEYIETDENLVDEPTEPPDEPGQPDYEEQFQENMQIITNWENKFKDE